MLIKRIRVDGFRNIDDVSIEFGDIVALVGLNNYGKSNLIDSIDFAQDFIKYPIEGKNYLMRMEKNLPINTKTASRDFNFEIEYSTLFDGQETDVIYQFSFEWIKTENKGCNIKTEVLKLKEKSNLKFSKYIIRKDNNGFYKSSKTGRTDAKVKIEKDELIVNKLQNYDNLYYKEIIEEINKLNFDLNYFSDTSHAFEFFPFEWKKEGLYSLEKQFGENINKIVYHMKEDYPEKYQLLINSFKSLVPSIEMVEPVRSELSSKLEAKFKLKGDPPFKIVDSVYSIRVKEKQNNQPTKFESLSNGSKRMFLLLTSAILADIQKISLIAFEELENCVHPYLFQRLLITLSEIITDCRIIVTSHSPYLIQYLDLNNIYIGVPCTEGVAKFNRVKKSMHKTLYKNAREEEVSVGDYIFNLLVDSNLDNSMLLAYLGG